MTPNKKTADGPVESLLALVQALRDAPGGAALLAHIDGGETVRAGLRTVIDRAFVAFVRNAVDRYGRTAAAPTDRITRLKLKLIEQRLGALNKAAAQQPALPELPDAAALVQHLVAVLWAAAQTAGSKQAASTDVSVQAGGERFKPLQQALETKLDRAILSNLDSIAALGSIELTLKGVPAGELEEWRDILHDAAREVIEDYRGLGESLRQAQVCARDIGRQITGPGRSASTPQTVGRERSELLRRLEAEMRRAQRYRLPLSLALLGPDHLEDIRMLVGAQAAGEIMRRYHQGIVECARAYDTIAGCRPHTLLWLLPGADPLQGVKALGKARERLTSAHYRYGGRLRPLPSFSAGVVAFTPGEKSAHFLARAEVLAARARLAGPSRIECDRRQQPATAG